MRIQLAGNLQLGPDVPGLANYSDQISSLVLNRRRPGVTRPATFGDPTTQQRPGADEYQVTINFFHDEGDANSFWAEAWAAMDTATGELYFEGTFGPGAANPATNPKFTGWIQLVDLDTGGTVGEWKQQSKTFPARNVTKVAV